MKKFFKDNTLEYQYMPENVAIAIFNVPDDLKEKAKTEKFIVLHNYKDENYSVQICINCAASYETNNGYCVFVFDSDDNLIGRFGYPSHTKYPPVWNREFGYIDYLDFLAIQKQINLKLKKDNLPTIEYDLSVKKRCFYSTKESPEEVKTLIDKNESYGIVSLFAEKCPNLVQEARKFIGV